MSDIFREVDEALQQDKIAKIWKEYSSTIIAALLILIVSTAIGTFYKKWDAGRNATETARLNMALQADDPHAAIAELVKDTRKGHGALALMSAANLHLQDGKKEEAAALYKKIADNKKSPRNIRDLARVLYIQNTNASDIKILQPLLGNDKSPWVWHARLEAAVITAHTDKDYTKALGYLSKFEGEQYIPATLKQRAKALSHVYALKAQEEKTNKTENK